MTDLQLRHESFTLPGGPVAGPSFPKSDGYIHRRNLHHLWADYLKPLHALCLEYGGRNRHGQPNYRLVYGWECPQDYVGKKLEFFHMQRWVPVADFCSEAEWNWNERVEAQRLGSRYVMQPYPRHGEYLHIRTCRGGGTIDKPVPPSQATFRRPDHKWVAGAIISNQLQLNRTAQEIRDEVAESNEYWKRLEREKAAKTGDEFQIREMAETMAAMLIANPTLRRDPSLLLSPAVSYKRTKHRIRTTL